MVLLFRYLHFGKTCLHFLSSWWIISGKQNNENSKVALKLDPSNNSILKSRNFFNDV